MNNIFFWKNICLIIVWIHFTQATWWLLGTDHHHHFLNDVESQDQPFSSQSHCENFPFFINHQRKLCRETGGKILTTIKSGAKLGIEECQFQLQSHRWNCSIIKEAHNAFGKVLNIHTREKAYVHAISSAALAYEVTKSCSRGELDKCSCDEEVRLRNTKGKWQWGGCSEDVKFGAQFAKEFADSMENSTTAEGLMNLHNNEAGRRLLKTSMNTSCKCHGVSGSCTMKVCWRVLSSFRTVGEKINEKFQGAFRMKPIIRVGPAQIKKRKDSVKGTEFNKIQQSLTSLKLKPFLEGMKRPTKRDLVFIEESPDYCEQNQTINILGTKGRTCNMTSDKGSADSCVRLCCSRGYQTMIRTGVESCNCQFVWCCKVQCEMCPYKREEYVCN